MNDPDTSADSLSAPLPAPEPAPESAPVEPEPAAPGEAAMPASPEPVPHAGARYALLRLLTLVAVGGILYVLGMRGWLLAFTAVLVSGIVSLFLLMKQRNDAAVNLERTVDGWKHRRDQEDAGLAQE